MVDMWLFFARGRSGRLLGSILRVPGGLPGQFWDGFCLKKKIVLKFCLKVGPNFVHVSDRWVFRHRFSSLLALPFSWRGGGRAERFKLIPQEIDIVEHNIILATIFSESDDVPKNKLKI